MPHTHCEGLYIVTGSGNFFIEAGKQMGIERLPEEKCYARLSKFIKDLVHCFLCVSYQCVSVNTDNRLNR